MSRNPAAPISSPALHFPSPSVLRLQTAGEHVKNLAAEEPDVPLRRWWRPITELQKLYGALKYNTTQVWSRRLFHPVFIKDT